MLGRRRARADREKDTDELDSRTAAAEEADEASEAAESDGDDEVFYYSAPPAPRPEGPWDVGELDDPNDGRVDLGGVLVPGVDGMELRVEVADGVIVAATVILGQTAIQLQPFAAPKSEGIWASVRREIAAGVTRQGGVVDEIDGPLGVELRARVPVKAPDGSQGVQLVRFVGCDGPRWFLRGVISGQGAVQPEAAGPVEELFRNIAVVRGADPMAPRDPIPLRLPPETQLPGAETAEAPETNPYAGTVFNPMQRGPEITETR